MRRPLVTNHWRPSAVCTHTAGGWWIWAIFASSYGKRVVEEPAYLPFAALVLAVALLRLASMFRR